MSCLTGRPAILPDFPFTYTQTREAYLTQAHDLWLTMVGAQDQFQLW